MNVCFADRVPEIREANYEPCLYERSLVSSW